MPNDDPEGQCMPMAMKPFQRLQTNIHQILGSNNCAIFKKFLVECIFKNSMGIVILGLIFVVLIKSSSSMNSMLIIFKAGQLEVLFMPVFLTFTDNEASFAIRKQIRKIFPTMVEPIN